MKTFNSIWFIGTDHHLEEAINKANTAYRKLQEDLEQLEGEIISVNTNLTIEPKINIPEYNYIILVTYSTVKWTKPKKILLTEKKLELEEGEEKYWEVIGQIGWGTKCTKKEEVADILRPMDPVFVRRLYTFIVRKRNELTVAFDAYAMSKTGSIKNFWGVGDDGFWDLRSHIVGLGEILYYKCKEEPEIAKKIADTRQFIENFEYGITTIIKEHESKTPSAESEEIK